jgi:aspartyl-tRNA(Asn)/glutamyl-tRNA(Gln) amidotransferase subunit B
MSTAYEEALANFEPVFGLETHVELGTRSKMFCGCPTTFGAAPNTHVCPTCLGLPGSLPVTNAAAIESTIRIGLALHCTIASWCRFARKNYFYPDLPKNFQISQYDEPLCVEGYLDVEVGGEVVRVGIERVHLEEDTGKSLHVGGSTGRIHGATHSLVDYNRAGIPLVEIVTKPVPGTGALAPEVARAYVTELRETLRALNVSDVRMEEGSLRCDVNLSLNSIGASEWGTRSETKNVNSLRSVERAVRSEIERQADVLSSGGRVKQETRHFHEDSGLTTSGRSKEQADQTWCRSRLPRAGSKSCGRRFQNFRSIVGGGCATSGASQCSRCRRLSTRVRSDRSRPRLPSASPPVMRTSGGWASLPGRPMSAASRCPSCR